MAHKSLSLKLKTRQLRSTMNNDGKKKLSKRQKLKSVDNLLYLMSPDTKVNDENLNFINAEMKMLNYDNNEIKDHDQGFTYQVIYQQK
jgi:hypothetical protein